jgi:hypothetical protein
MSRLRQRDRDGHTHSGIGGYEEGLRYDVDILIACGIDISKSRLKLSRDSILGEGRRTEIQNRPEAVPELVTRSEKMTDGESGKLAGGVQSEESIGARVGYLS